MPSKTERLITCLAVYRIQRVNHHCTLPRPHMAHRCPCGIEWPEGDGLVG